jgi:hypothetical protein
VQPPIGRRSCARNHLFLAFNSNIANPESIASQIEFTLEMGARGRKNDPSAS